MGIINHDAFVSRYGPSFTDTYISIHTNDIDVCKEINTVVDNPDDPPVTTVTYNVNFCATVWATQADKDSNKSALGTVTFTDTMDTTTPLDMNIYAYAYSKIKARFPNSTDV